MAWFSTFYCIGEPTPKRFPSGAELKAMTERGHPLYGIGIVFLLLDPAPSAKWLLLAVLSAGYCVVASRWEEERMLRRHGQAYAAYRRAVPPFVPNLKRRHIEGPTT